jgi:hypothetical protein
MALFGLGCCCSDAGKEKNVITVDPQSESPNHKNTTIFEEAAAPPPLAPVAPPSPLAEIPIAVQPVVKPACKEFRVRLDKGAGGILGLELDLLDGKHGLITDIKPGILQDYNNAVLTTSDQIQKLDIIVEANNVSGDVQKLLRTLKTSSTIDMLIRRNTCFKVEVRKSPGDDLTSTMTHATSGVALLIIDVHDLFKEWNAKNPQLPVKQHDRVVEVNGKRDDPSAMLEVIQGPGRLSFLIMSPAL